MATKNQTLSVLLDGTGKVKSAYNPAMGLSNLSDVDITNIADEKTLKYNSSTSKWEIADLGINTSSLISVASVDTAFSDLVGTAPAELDTLSEIATRLNDDPTFATGWAAYQGRQKTKTWTGMTGKGPTGSLPVGQSGATVQLTDGVDGSTNSLGIPVEADLKHANVEVFLNGVMMKNVYRSTSDGTSQFASGEYDYLPHDGTVSSGVTSFTRFDLSGSIANNDIFELYFDMDIATGDSTFGPSSGQDIYNKSNQADWGTVYVKSGSQIGDPAEGGAGNQDGTYAYRLANAGMEDPMMTYFKFQAQAGEEGTTGMDWWLANSGSSHNNTALELAWFAPGNEPSGGVSIWDGIGAQPTMNYIKFPNIDFIADDVLTIRTF